MSSEESLWFRLGYALESAKLPSAPRDPQGVAGLAERGPRDRSEKTGESLLADQLVTAGMTALAARVLDAWQPRRKVGFKRLLWAGAAGAAAALLIEVLKPILRRQPELPILDRDTGDRLLAGVSQGLLYGAVVEPRVPGPDLLKGALFGSAEYATDATGGLAHLLRAHAPLGRLPFVGRILEDVDPRDRVYVEHLAFGIVLALLYGASPSSNGMLPDDE
jgi:hypothetical protein